MAFASQTAQVCCAVYLLHLVAKGKERHLYTHFQHNPRHCHRLRLEEENGQYNARPSIVSPRAWTGADGAATNTKVFLGPQRRSAELRLMSRARDWLEQTAAERVTYLTPPAPTSDGGGPPPPFPNTLLNLQQVWRGITGMGVRGMRLFPTTCILPRAACASLCAVPRVLPSFPHRTMVTQCRVR